MNIQPIKFPALIALSLFMTATMAGSGHHGKGAFMRMFDSNADGMVTQAEFQEAAAKRFTLMDSNSSGIVSKDEFRQYIKERRAKRAEKKFQLMDTDGSGDVSQQEYLDYKRQKAERRFQSMDKDANGILSKDELQKKRRYGKKFGKRGKGRIFQKLDKDGNGEITREESLAAWTDWFSRIDLNKDQVVTTEEVQDYRQRKMDSKL